MIFLITPPTYLKIYLAIWVPVKGTFSKSEPSKQKGDKKITNQRKVLSFLFNI